MIGYVVWNPSKEHYLSANLEWTRYVKDARIFDTNKDAMTAIEAMGVRGLRVLEKFIRIDTLTHKIHVNDYKWLTKEADPAKIQELGGTVRSGGKYLIVEFPEFEIRYDDGDAYFTVSGANQDEFKNIIKEKLNNHE
nr:MAG TPA: hypothetical protein [Caudoviricetes sp.]